MQVILIGGPYNHKVMEIEGNLNKLDLIYYENTTNGAVRKPVSYSKTPAIIEGLPAYKYESGNN